MDHLFEFLIEEANKPFEGWDFSYISGTGRTAVEPLPWSYTSELLLRLRQSNHLLDMGTGGGEYLSMLQPLPKDTFATEGYEPNVPIAKNRLEPIGVTVKQVINDEELPFTDEQFDLIINRHEAYSPIELYRIMKPNGVFITQQVGGRDQIDLNEAFGANLDFGFAHWQLDFAVAELVEAGFHIVKKHEAFVKNLFYDVGAIVYYLKAIPWQIPDFKVENYYNELKAIHKQIEKTGYFECTQHRFFIMAEKK